MKITFRTIISWLILIAGTLYFAAAGREIWTGRQTLDLMSVLVFVGIPVVVVLVRTIDRVRHEKFIERKNRGLCAHCGYDIRGNSGKCPECGKWTVRN
jgi:hypothetical protein